MVLQQRQPSCNAFLYNGFAECAPANRRYLQLCRNPDGDVLACVFLGVGTPDCGG
jgi:hypothetical protein